MTTKPHRGIKQHPENKQTALPGASPVTLPLAGVTVDTEIQQRTSMDAALIAEYQANVGDWIAQAPIIVFFDGTTRWLADGFHRHAAALAAGLESIPARVYQGTRREALLSDAEWSARSDRWIADTAKVSHPLVAKVRAELEQLEKLPVEDPAPDQLGNSPVEPNETRVGQDGKARALPPPDPEKDALKAELAKAKQAAKEWRAQWKNARDAGRDTAAKLKDQQQVLKDAEAVHREHLIEMRQRIAEEERNRPRTDAELAEQQSKLKALQDDAARAQTALNQAALEKERIAQRQAFALQDRIINDFGNAAITYRETALRLIGTADALKKIPMSDALFHQVKLIRDLSAGIMQAMDDATAAREVR